MSIKSKGPAAATLTLVSAAITTAVLTAGSATAACCGGPRSPRASKHAPVPARDYGHQPAQTGPDEPVEPSGSPPSQSPSSHAAPAIGRLGSGSPPSHQQFRAARHHQAEADRIDAEAAQVGPRNAVTGERAAAEHGKANPHKRINRRFGTVLAVALALLDALPAYWSTRALGLDQTSALIVTVLLCAAFGGTMWLLDPFSGQGRRSALRIFGGTLAAGFTTVLILRLQYLQVTGVAGFSPGAIEALALTAISAALVTVGLLSARAGRRPDPRSTATAVRRASLSVLAVGWADTGSSQAAPRRAPSPPGHRVQPGWTG